MSLANELQTTYAWARKTYYSKSKIYHIANTGINKKQRHGAFMCGTEVYGYDRVDDGEVPPEGRRLCKRCAALGACESDADYFERTIAKHEQTLNKLREKRTKAGNELTRISSAYAQACDKHAAFVKEYELYKKSEVLVKVNDTISIDGVRFIVWDLGCHVKCLVNVASMKQYKKKKFLQEEFNARMFFSSEELVGINSITKVQS